MHSDAVYIQPDHFTFVMSDGPLNLTYLLVDRAVIL